MLLRKFEDWTGNYVTKHKQDAGEEVSAMCEESGGGCSQDLLCVPSLLNGLFGPIICYYTQLC